MNFLAFDLGASSGRAILGILENGKLDLQEIHRFPNGHKTVDGELFWDYPALAKELKEGLKKALAVTKDIAAIGVDTWGVDYVLFDKDTKAMKRLPYHYRDTRTEKYLDEIWSKVSKDEIYSRTGIQFMPFNTLYQLYAHKAEHPEDFENAQFLHMPDALAFALGGNFETEYTIASTGNCVDAKTQDWDFELIDKLGLPRSIFPKIVQPCTQSGVLSAELQKELNAPAIPIIKVGGHDTASAVVAVPAKADEKFAYISCGTWALLGAELNAPSLDIKNQVFTNEGGVDRTIRYLTNIMGCWLLQETRRDWVAKGKDIGFAEMSKRGSETEGFKYLINPNNAFFSAPDNMPARIREFASRYTPEAKDMSDADLLRTLYDSLGLCFRKKLADLSAITGIDYKVLNIIGGGTQDRTLMQSSADAGQITVVAGPIEATAIGNILAMAMALKVVDSLADAREIVRNSFEVITYTPNKANAAKWNEAFDKFNKID